LPGEPFSEKIYLIFEGGPQTPKLVGDHSIVVMADARIAFTHGRNQQGSMVQPTQYMSTVKCEELWAKYRKIRTASEPHYVRAGSKLEE
jgi:hypothetical protein